MTEPTEHRVLVDFAVTGASESVVTMALDSPYFSEYVQVIAPTKYQVGMAVSTSNVGEAYRRAVDAVQANLAMMGAMNPKILGATVYYEADDGEEEKVTFD